QPRSSQGRLFLQRRFIGTIRAVGRRRGLRSTGALTNMDQPTPTAPPPVELDESRLEEFHTLEEQNREHSFKEIMRRPVSIAALSLGLGVVALVAYLERGSFQI